MDQHWNFSVSKASRPIYLGLVFLLVVALCPGLAYAKPVQFPDKLVLLQMLREEKFKALDTRISAYQQAYERQPVKDKEDLVVFAASAFRNSDPALEAKLNQWIEQMPKSYAARIARGFYYRHLALLSRGEAYASETARKQMEGMLHYFSKAVPDYEAAMALNPKLSVAYASLIEIAMVQGGRNSIDNWVSAGLKIDPYSFAIGQSYVFALQPKWGGSLNKMRSFVDSLEQYLAKNPGLAALRGYVYYAEADILKLSGKRRRAVELFNRAVQSGKYWRFVYERGENYYRLGEYDKALADFNEALEIWPQHPWPLKLRAWIRWKQGNADLAMNDLNLVLNLDSLDPDALRARALLLKKEGKSKEALQDTANALKFGSHDAYVWWTRGELQLYQFKDYPNAAQSLKRATELDPDEAGMWFDYSVALNGVKDCTIVDALQKYLSLCERGGKCNEERLKWAKDAIPILERNSCPRKFLDWRRVWHTLQSTFLAVVCR